MSEPTFRFEGWDLKIDWARAPAVVELVKAAREAVNKPCYTVECSHCGYSLDDLEVALKPFEGVSDER